MRTIAQIAAWRISMSKRPHIPWNKGKSYVIGKRVVYANKGAWNMAMRRMYSDKCMRCGWSESSCDTHHVIPKGKGGQYSLDNGVILCPNCHRLADYGKIGINELKSIKARAAPINKSV